MNANPHESPNELKNEIERLQKLVEQLQKERDRDRETIKAIQEEKSSVLQYLWRKMKIHYTQEQLEQWANEEPEDGVSLSEFIDELEQIANGRPTGK